ncbi:MAG: hypothetical protein JST84_09010 [Acidobacteria bacterium]|nr:hypothetical protein [Acidobacteriota bacterium]
MSEHLTKIQFENFFTRRLSPGELVAAARHIAICIECREQVKAKAGATERVAALQSSFYAEALPPHLSYEQLAAYVEKNADEVEQAIITNHLAICQQCATEAKELQELADSLANRKQPARKNFFARLRDAWQRSSLLHPLPLAATAAAIVLLLTAGWWLLRKPTAPQSSIAVTQTLPAATPAATASLPPTPTPVASPRLALNDNGQQIAVDQTGKVIGLGDLPKEAERVIRLALDSQRVEVPAELKTLVRRPATLMSGAAEAAAIKLQSPVGTFVNDTRPAFRWQAMKGAQNYTVQVLDDQFNIVATSPQLMQPNWRVTPSLKRGQEYLWQVTAEVDGKRMTSSSASTPEAHFKILSAEKARGLQTMVQGHNSHLLRGTMYARAGLLDEAEREYQALLKANPHSTVARKLLQHLRAQRKS